ncbi:MAG: hypothetical protein M9947_00405 [Thermomicrobiales bacterium]|nr:hypothetical protein [Thermomicrobiales bacterium]
MSRLRRFPTAILIVILAATSFAGGLTLGPPVSAQEVGDPAEQLLMDAAERMLGYQTMKFDLVYEKGSTNLFTGIKMTKASGAIERPGKMEATVQTKIGFVKINIKATVIGDKAEVRAVGINEDYTLPSSLAHIIADPVLLLPDLVGAVENPVVSSIETTKTGARIIWITGTFNPALIQDDAVRGYAESLGARPVDVAINEDGLISSVRIGGSFVSYDSNDVVRRLDIYGYGEPVDISG